MFTESVCCGLLKTLGHKCDIAEPYISIIYHTTVASHCKIRKVLEIVSYCLFKKTFRFLTNWLIELTQRNINTLLILT